MKNPDYPPTPSNETKELHEQSVAELKEALANNEEVTLETPEARETKIEEVRGSIDQDIEKALDKKDTGEESLTETHVSIPANYEAPKQNFFTKTWKKAMVTLGMVGVMGSAAANSGPEKPVKDSSTVKKEVNLASARKVKEIPADYTIVKKDDKTYGYKVNQGTKSKLEMAKPSKEKGGDAYENDLIKKLKSGISAEELAEKGYISPSKIPEYSKYYVPASADVVYLEGKQAEVKKTNTEDPFAAFAKEGQGLYAPGTGGHIAAEYFYPARVSNAVTEGGMLDTRKSDVLVRFRGDFGFTGEAIIVSSDDFTKLTSGRNHFQSQEQMLALKDLAKKNGGIAELSAEELAKLTLAKN